VKTPHLEKIEELNNFVLLTTDQAARYIQCSPRYIQRMVRQGRLRGLKPSGKLVRFRRIDLDRFLESGATTGTAK
jgi:excisionase family DNA binding protein